MGKRVKTKRGFRQCRIERNYRRLVACFRQQWKTILFAATFKSDVISDITNEAHWRLGVRPNTGNWDHKTLGPNVGIIRLCDRLIEKPL